MNRRQRILALFTAVVMIVLVLPFSENMNAQTDDRRCFPETGQCISGRIKEFWESNGELAVFGLPITDQDKETIEGKPLQVQWFERNRLELHPENEPPYDVLLGRLGVDVLEKNGHDWKSFPKETPKAGCEFFEQTGFNVCDDILARWQNPESQLGSLELFGLPISPLQLETLEGNEYKVQWFERARFELHPENNPPHNVLLGRLGNELYATDPSEEPSITQGPVALPSSEYIAFFSKPEPSLDSRLYTSKMSADGSRQIIFETPYKHNADPAWSPDDSLIAFSALDGNAWNIYIMNSDGQDIRQITQGQHSDSHPSWSPDGTELVFQTNRHPHPAGDKEVNWEIYAVNVETKQERRLTDNPARDQFASWSPDGSKIVFQSDRDGNFEIYVMDMNDGKVSRLTNNDAADMRPSWSKDGSKIAFESNRDTRNPDGTLNRDGTLNIYVMNADGSDVDVDVEQLTTTKLPNKNPSWSADGTKITFASLRDANWEIYAMNDDGTGQTRLTRNLIDDMDPAWSSVSSLPPGVTPAPLPDQPVEEVEGPGGKIAYMAEVGGARDIFVMNSNGSGKTNITNTPADEFAPAWSPDGSKIAFTSRRDGNWEIYVANADGSNPIRLTDHVEADTYPAWSPDGSLIAFNSERTGYADIYLIKSDGSSTEPINLTNSTSYEWKPTWSPNGQYIAFDSTRDGNAEIYMLEVANPSNQIRLTNDPGEDENPAWSHDGQWIAFQSTRGGGTTYDIYIMDINGGSVRNITNNPSHNMHPAWSPDDTHITFMSNRDGSEDIFVISIEGYGDNNLTNTPGDERFPSWTR